MTSQQPVIKVGTTSGSMTVTQIRNDGVTIDANGNTLEVSFSDAEKIFK